jgi:hypothetical protein
MEKNKIPDEAVEIIRMLENAILHAKEVNGRVLKHHIDHIYETVSHISLIIV